MENTNVYKQIQMTHYGRLNFLRNVVGFHAHSTLYTRETIQAAPGITTR